MIKKHTLSIAVLMICPVILAQENEYIGKIHVTPISLQQRGDSVYAELRFDISGLNVDSRRSISLVPTLVTPEKKQSLPEVMLKGRQNYNIHRRKLALMSKREKNKYDKAAPYCILKGYKSDTPKTIHYYTAIAYEPWMADANLDLYEDLCGCGNLPRRIGISNLINQVTLEKIVILDPYEITPHLAYIRPIAEVVKHRELISETFLDFVVNKTDINPKFMNNQAELLKITNLINELDNDPDLKIEAIHVVGFASLEGSVDLNQRLSEGRANSLVAFLVPRFNYPRSFYNVEYGGENWSGLKDAVEKSDMPFRDQVLDIIDSGFRSESRNDTELNLRLKSLDNGGPYKYMLQTFYPSLRKAICKIDFEVSDFDVSHAKEVIMTKPQKLSLNEIFLVANTYEKGSREFVDLFETAVRLFPHDITANLNAASAALVRKDLISAERYLNKIKTKTDTPEYYNALGTLSMLKGDYEDAQTALRKAANAGLNEAMLNLEEIRKKQENILEMEQNKSGNKR